MLLKRTLYYTPLNEDYETGNDRRIELGANKTRYPSLTKSGGDGFTYATKEDLCKYLKGYDEIDDVKYIAEVYPDDEALVVEFGDLYNANIIFVTRVIPIEAWEAWEDKEFVANAVNQDGRILKFIKEPSEELCLAAVQQWGCTLQYVKEQSEELCLAAVKQTGYAIDFVKEQTPKVCLAAVKQIGDALEYIKEQTPKVCLAAVQNNGCALQYVIEQNLVICIAAVQNDPAALEYVDPKFKEVCEAVIEASKRVKSSEI